MTNPKKCIYAISSNQTCQYMLNNKFFLDQSKARKRLREMADERKHNLGVQYFKQDEDSFSFILGWEEVQVSFRIIELPLEDA